MIMEKQMRCPVCGQLNKHTTYKEGYSVVEEHYFCSNCSFFIEMAYSPSYVGVIEGMFGGYEKEVEELGLHIFSEREAYSLIT